MLGSRQSTTVVERKSLTLLEEIKQQNNVIIQQLQHLGGRTAEQDLDFTSLPEGVTLPVRTMDEMDQLHFLVEDNQIRGKVVGYLLVKCIAKKFNLAWRCS